MKKFYKLGKVYAPLAEHNVTSMMKIVYLFYSKPLHKCLNNVLLEAAIGIHPQRGGAAGFIRYLAKRGHLIETNGFGRKL